MGLGNKEIVNGLDLDGQNITSLSELSQRGIDSSALPGDTVANAPQGVGAIASGATSVTITNTFVTAAS
jgi:hypothetical protein